MARGVWAAVAVVGAGCGAPEALTLAAGDVEVSLTASPFVLEVRAAGAVLLRTLAGGGEAAEGTFASTTDEYEEVPQLLPGWDGYVAHEGAWRRELAATLEATGEAAATARFGPEDAPTGTLEVAIDGPRVRLRYRPTGGPNKSTVGFELPADEHFFGLGERFVSVDHRGQSLYAWAEEGALGLGEGEPAGPRNPSPNGPSMTYFPVPFFHSSRGYGLWIETTHRSEVHLGSESPDRWRLAVNDDAIDLTVYASPRPLEVLELFTADTGRPMMPALWSFGPRRRTGLGSRVDGVEEWKLLRRRRVPTTVIDDSVHFLPQRSELGREAELLAFTTLLHGHGFKVTAYNNPYISSSLEAGREDYEYGKARRYFVLDPSGEPAETTLISGELQNVVSVDFTNPEAVSWYQGLLRRTLALGFDGWMHDFGEYIRRDALLAGGRGDELHNLYPVLSAKAAFDLLEAERPGDYLIYVRAGYAGTQKYTPEVWGGDPEATFDETQGLPASARAGINLGLSGVPFWGSDISGFKCMTEGDARDKEVYLRWAQLGAVSTSMHDENACANPIARKSKWTLWSDEETTRVYGDLARLHTRLAPYFWALAKEAHETGHPVMRHPFLVEPRAPGAWAVEDAFFVGDGLYAAPVVRRNVRVRAVYLPGGRRYVDLAGHALYEGGGVVEVAAPLERLPLFLVEGGLVPLFDPSIETLVAGTSTTVVSPAEVDDRLDVWVALGPGGRAERTLVDGTRLVAEYGAAGGDSPLAVVSPRELDQCAGCVVEETVGQLTRVRANSSLAAESELTRGGLVLRATSPRPRRIRWDVARLP